MVLNNIYKKMVSKEKTITKEEIDTSKYIDFYEDCEIMSSNELNFGKYKGKTFEEVYDADNKYCSRILRRNTILKNKDKNNRLQSFKQYIKNKIYKIDEEDNGNTILSFGKYEGHTFKEASKDIDYCYEKILKDYNRPDWGILNFHNSYRRQFQDYLINDLDFFNNEEIRKKLDNEELGFGKYKDKTYKYISDNQKGYIRWMKSLENPSRYIINFLKYYN